MEGVVFVPYAITQLNLPKTIKSIGVECFYSLVNMESLDLSELSIKNDYVYTVTTYSTLPGYLQQIDTSQASGNILNRVKLANLKMGYTISYSTAGYKPAINYINGQVVDINDTEKIAMFKDENGAILSQWIINPLVVRINELQDAPVKEGYTFIGWTKQSAAFSAAKSLKYTIYTPQYQQGQPIWDFEDNVRFTLANTGLSETTTNEDITRILNSCKTHSNIEYTIENFRVIPAQWDTRGAVRFKVNIKDNITEETSSIDIDKYTTSLPNGNIIKDYVDIIKPDTDTSAEHIEEQIKNGLDDVGLDVKVEGFKNDGKYVQGVVNITNSLTGEKEYLNIKLIIESAIAEILNEILGSGRYNALTNPVDIKEEIEGQLGNGYTVDVGEFENTDGKVAASVTVKTPSDKSITQKLESTIKERTQTLAQVKDMLTSIKSSIKVGDRTIADDIINTIESIVTDTSIIVDIPDFKNDNGKVTGTITMTDADTKEVLKEEIVYMSNSAKVRGNIDKIPLSASSKDTDIINSIKSLVGNDVIVSLTNFKNDGVIVSGLIDVTNTDSTVVSIPMNLQIISQTTAEASLIVKKNLSTITVGVTTTQEEILSKATVGVKDALVTVYIENFMNDGKSVTGDIIISKLGEEDTTVKLSKVVSGISDGVVDGGTDTPGGNNNTPGGTGQTTNNTNTITGGNSTVGAITNTTGASTSSMSNNTITGGTTNITTGGNNITFNPTLGNNTITNGNITINLGK